VGSDVIQVQIELNHILYSIESGSGIFSSATSPVLKKEPVSSDTLATGLAPCRIGMDTEGGDDPQSCINVFKAIKTI
jgi:hypothetical protein